MNVLNFSTVEIGVSVQEFANFVPKMWFLGFWKDE